MDGNNICRGQLCVPLFFLLLLFILMNYIIKYIISRLLFSQTPPSLPITVAHQNTPLPEQSPRHRHVLQSIPAVPYDAAIRPNATDSETEICAVCLAEFEKGEEVKVLPKCKHCYHVECIDNWLLRSVQCPMCRVSVIDQQSFPMVLLESSRTFHLNRNRNFHRPIASLVPTTSNTLGPAIIRLF